MAIAALHGQQITFIPNGVFFANPGGASETYSTTGGGIDQTGPFFQSLGTNGRSCGSCHQPSDGMSVSAAHVEQRFSLTQGLDPIFRTVDGSNGNHGIDVSTLAGRSAAYCLLRTRGLIVEHNGNTRRLSAILVTELALVFDPELKIEDSANRRVKRVDRLPLTAAAQKREEHRAVPNAQNNQR